MYVCTCVRVLYGRKQEENTQENEEASISLELRLLYAKQAVVTRGDFRELPLLGFIHRIHQEVIIVYNKASLANRKV